MNPRLVAFEGWLGSTSSRPLAIMSEGWLARLVTARNKKIGNRWVEDERNALLARLHREDEELLVILWGFLHAKTS
jgi:hypothetical protein